MSRKVIITCAVTGESPYNKAHPCFPITPQQIADAALEAEEAGAAAVHLHARNPETGEHDCMEGCPIKAQCETCKTTGKVTQLKQ